MGKEGQQFGQNPEWEANKEQNIAIARKVDSLLLTSPEAMSTLMDNAKRIGMSEERFIELANSFKGMFSELSMMSIKSMEDIGFMIAKEELTVGYTRLVQHIDNLYRRIFLGVGYSERARGDESRISDIEGFIDLLPQGFNFPAYIISGSTFNEYDDSSEFDSSTIEGELPNQIIGVDGFLYQVRNIYCLNLSGQGLKIEEIIRLEKLEEYNEENRRLAEQKLITVDFVPSEEHSRIMPLTPDDYVKVSKMFEDIDAGLYKPFPYFPAGVIERHPEGEK